MTPSVESSFVPSPDPGAIQSCDPRFGSNTVPSYVPSPGSSVQTLVQSFTLFEMLYLDIF